MTNRHDPMSERTRASLEALRPLIGDEAERATAQALGALARHGAGEGLDPVVYSVGLRIGKPGRGEVATRSIAVLLYDRRRSQAWEVLVDARWQATARDLPGYQPPFLAGEVDEARTMAEAALRSGGLDGEDVGVLPFQPGSDEPGRRVGLNFVRSTPAGTVGVATFVVDLSSGQVERRGGR